MKFLLYGIAVLLLCSIMSWGSMLGSIRGPGSGGSWHSSSGSGGYSSGGGHK
ncbi:MAG: hypothetical protein IPL03_18835 [Sterolibacteriaceae bacterium]|nr:hypothetical protein [Candidatus Methylophosphatis haderslevensis]